MSNCLFFWDSASGFLASLVSRDEPWRSEPMGQVLCWLWWCSPWTQIHPSRGHREFLLRENSIPTRECLQELWTLCSPWDLSQILGAKFSLPGSAEAPHSSREGLVPGAAFPEEFLICTQTSLCWESSTLAKQKGWGGNPGNP